MPLGSQEISDHPLIEASARLMPLPDDFVEANFVFDRAPQHAMTLEAAFRGEELANFCLRLFFDGSCPRFRAARFMKATLLPEIRALTADRLSQSYERSLDRHLFECEEVVVTARRQSGDWVCTAIIDSRCAY